MQTKRISTNLSFVLFIFCLFLLGTIVPVNQILAQKDCINTVTGDLFLDDNRNGIKDLNEDGVAGAVSIVAEKTSKETVYQTPDGTFVMENIACDKYTGKYNGFIITNFEVDEVVGHVVKLFPITPEILAQNIPEQQPSGDEQIYTLYLPLITK